jgi:hypothetical protein
MNHQGIWLFCWTSTMHYKVHRIDQILILSYYRAIILILSYYRAIIQVPWVQF